ncbi:MAG: 5,6-dimethylbenzimidazole synthase, partial [Blastocatellia bacterium]
ILDPLELAAILKLPENVYPVAYVCLGYVDEFPSEPELQTAGWRSRAKLGDLVHRNFWNGKLDDLDLIEAIARNEDSRP